MESWPGFDGNIEFQNAILAKSKTLIFHLLLESFLLMKSILWKAMLDAEFNSKYWNAITQKYSKFDLYLKIFLAITASGTVAGWAVWESWPLFWKILSAFAAVLSLINPILSFSKKAEIAAGHAGLWADLRIRYADLWDKFLTNQEAPSIAKENEQLRKIFRNLEAEEPKLKIPYHPKLAKKCQDDILRLKNLKKEI